MSIVTESNFTYCSNCNRQITSYVLELGYNGPICCNCLVKSNGGFPKGKSIYQPCTLCQVPEIHWFCEDDYCSIGPCTNTDCGLHGIDYGIDMLYDN